MLGPQKPACLGLSSSPRGGPCSPGTAPRTRVFLAAGLRAAGTSWALQLQGAGRRFQARGHCFRLRPTAWQRRWGAALRRGPSRPLPYPNHSSPLQGRGRCRDSEIWFIHRTHLPGSSGSQPSLEPGEGERPPPAGEGEGSQSPGQPPSRSAVLVCAHSLQDPVPFTAGTDSARGDGIGLFLSHGSRRAILLRPVVGISRHLVNYAKGRAWEAAGGCVLRVPALAFLMGAPRRVLDNESGQTLSLRRIRSVHVGPTFPKSFLRSQENTGQLPSGTEPPRRVCHSAKREGDRVRDTAGRDRGNVNKGDRRGRREEEM